MMKLLTLSSVMTTSSKLERVKEGRKIIMQRCERKYYGNAIIKEAFLRYDEISMKSTAFLKGIVKIEGPTLADSNIRTLLMILFSWSLPIM